VGAAPAVIWNTPLDVLRGLYRVDYASVVIDYAITDLSVGAYLAISAGLDAPYVPFLTVSANASGSNSGLTFTNQLSCPFVVQGSSFNIALYGRYGILHGSTVSGLVAISHAAGIPEHL
jgi:hypothetical protein